MLKIHFTEKAAQRLKELKDELKVPEDYVLRLGIKSTSSCGSSRLYTMGFDEPQPGDMTFEFDDFVVAVHPTHAMHILGMKIDWKKVGEQEGFIFIDPTKEKN